MQAGVVKIDGINVYASLGTPQSKREEFKTDSPVPKHIGGCRTTFPFTVAESPKIVETGGEVSDPKRTSRGRVKRVVTLAIQA
jgi:hypothetical protein